MGRILPGNRSLGDRPGEGIKKYLDVLGAIKSTIPFINPFFKRIWKEAHRPDSSPRSKAAAQQLIDGLTPEQKAKLDELRAKQEDRGAQRVGGLTTPLGGAPIQARRGRATPTLVSPLGTAPDQQFGGVGKKLLSPGGLSLRPPTVPIASTPPMDLTHQLKRRALARLSGLYDENQHARLLMPREQLTSVVDILANPSHPQYEEVSRVVTLIGGAGRSYEAAREVIDALRTAGLAPRESLTPPPTPQLLPGAPPSIVPESRWPGAPRTEGLRTELMRREEPVERDPERRTLVGPTPAVPTPPPAPTRMFDMDVPVTGTTIDVGEFARRLRSANAAKAEARARALPEDLSQFSLAQLRAIRKQATSPEDIARLGEAARARGRFELPPGIMEALGGTTGAGKGERFVLDELKRPLTDLEIATIRAKLIDAQAKTEWRRSGSGLRKAQTGLTRVKTAFTEAKLKRYLAKLRRRPGGTAFLGWLRKNPGVIQPRQIKLHGQMVTVWEPAPFNWMTWRGSSDASRLRALKAAARANKISNPTMSRKDIIKITQRGEKIVEDRKMRELVEGFKY